MIVADNQSCLYLPHITEDDEPNLVTSGKSLRVVLEGYPFSIEIFRLEHEAQWTLEVVDAEGTSHVWDELFDSDREARDTAIRALEQEGPQAFVRGGSNVVPFRGR
ncbi:hypothetical protein [uncultured Marivita sp.]|uniref:hypothetical protein n=1 Tax=uncultured Marivita sp. TaxID=888080 RepID=UPI0026043E2D|nr:hypothetical protein [uncultured Marivita sp.]